MAFVTIIAFARAFPDDGLQIIRGLRRWLKALYARRYGQAAAASDLPQVYWDAQPWERHWQAESTIPPAPKESIWKLLRRSGLTPKYLFLAALFFLYRAGLIELELEEIGKD